LVAGVIVDSVASGAIPDDALLAVIGVALL